MKPIVLKIKNLAASERKITAEILDCIREIERFKIHLEMGYPSVMEFLVRECGYSETSALRRIDAARIVNAIPETREELKNGNLNLSQIAIVAQSVRQKEKLGVKVNLETKKELIKAVQHKRTFEVQKIAAQILDLPVVQMEKVKVQADESVRIEFSLTKAEMEILNKAKELLGHVKPGMNVMELVVLMAERVVKEKDPARTVRKMCKKVNGDESAPVPGANSDSASDLKLENSARDSQMLRARLKAEYAIRPTRVRAFVRRQVFQRDQGCQWVDPASKLKCGSRHLLEVDHKVPRWAGGENDLENLELKCRAHNQWKYRVEAGISVSLGGI